MDNYIKYFRSKLLKITYIDVHNKKLQGFLFSDGYVRKGDRLDLVKKRLDSNAKKIVEYEKVDGFIPIDVSYINRCDIDYHL